MCLLGFVSGIIAGEGFFLVTVYVTAVSRYTVFPEPCTCATLAGDGKLITLVGQNS